MELCDRAELGPADGTAWSPEEVKELWFGVELFKRLAIVVLGLEKEDMVYFSTSLFIVSSS